jgi:hypothetical protein
MTGRGRRIIGSAALSLFVLAYVAAAMVIGAVWFIEVGPLVQLAYFALAGVLWTLPAALIIRWMRGHQGGG